MINFVLKMLLPFLILWTLGGCKSSEQAKENQKAQNDINSQSQVNAENESTINKALLLENDLKTRHQFYQAVQGRYEGTFQTEQGAFQIRLTLSPTLFPYDFEQHRKARQLEEIIYDLNNLAFNVHIIQWKKDSPLSSVSCTIENVRPDLEKGTMNIISSTCKNTYIFSLSTNESNPESSSEISQQIMSRQQNSEIVLNGELQPGTNAKIYSMKLTKITSGSNL